MSWAKLDDGFHGHPKVLSASLSAVGLYAITLSYVARYGTDGRVSRTAVAMLGRGEHSEKLSAELVRAGLWEPDGDDFIIHDFLEYNPSSKSLERERRAARKRMHAFRSRSPEQTPNEQGTNAFVPDGTGRDGKAFTKRSEGARDLGAGQGDFDFFWQRYPRKVGKKDAEKAWRRTTLPTFPVLMNGLDRWVASDQWTRDGGRYIPHPATWLRHEQWTDEPLAPVRLDHPVGKDYRSTRDKARDIAARWAAEEAR